jgi:hypothetical protein
MVIPEPIDDTNNKVAFMCIAGKPKSSKSLLSQYLANKLKFPIVETELGKKYYKTTAKYHDCEKLSEIFDIVKKYKRPVVVDSISDPYRYEMDKAPFGRSNGVQSKSDVVTIASDICKTMRKKGGIVVAQGKMNPTPTDIINQKDKNYVPEGEFELYGNDRLEYSYDIIVLVAKTNQKNKRRMLIEGRGVPRQILEFEIVSKGTNKPPEIQGKGLDMLVELLTKRF